MNLMVVDLAIHARMVTAPDVCPACNVRLMTPEGSLALKPLFAIGRLSAVPGDTFGGEVVGESHIAEWLCAHCGASVAAGKIICSVGSKV